MYSITEGRRVLEGVDLVPGLPIEEVRSRLHVGLRLQETGQRVLAFYFAEMADRRLHQDSGHASTAHFAEDRFGLDRRRTSESIAVGRKLLHLPAIDDAFCEQRLGWSKLLLLVKVATPEHEAAWLARAQAASYRDLRREVQLSRPGSAPRSGNKKGLPEVWFRADARISAVTQQKIDLAQQKLSAERGEPVNLADLLDVVTETYLNLDEDGSVPGRVRVDSSLYRIILRPDADRDEDRKGERDGRNAPLMVDTDEYGPMPLADVEETCIRCDAACDGVHEHDDGRGGDGRGRSKSAVDDPTPKPLRNRVLARDGHRCRSCGDRTCVMVHHIVWRSDGGPTVASNLITLCARCHALVHALLLVIVGTHEKRIVFTDREGTPLQTEADALIPKAEILRLVRQRWAVAKNGGEAGEGAAPEPASSEAAVVAFDDVPGAIDGHWWSCHAHLIRFQNGTGLAFRAGTPQEDLAVSDTPKTDATEPEAPGRKIVDRVAEGDSPFRAAFEGMVGQDALLDRFETAARGSAVRGRPFPHTLLAGPPGTGKTTLARGVADARGRAFVRTTGPLLRDTAVLVGLLAELRPHDILFIDEIHAVPSSVLETLYDALADGCLHLTLHSGARARTVRFDFPAFTLVAATTEPGALPAALTGRFGLVEQLGYYAEADLACLASTRAVDQGFHLTTAGAARLAAYARGTPREVLRLLDRVLDYAACDGIASLDRPRVQRVLTALGFDADGLDPAEQHYLALLCETGRPMSLRLLARLMGTSPATVTATIEPFLVRSGLVEMTPRGRVATARAWARRQGIPLRRSGGDASPPTVSDRSATPSRAVGLRAVALGQVSTLR